MIKIEVDTTWSRAIDAGVGMMVNESDDGSLKEFTILVYEGNDMPDKNSDVFIRLNKDDILHINKISTIWVRKINESDKIKLVII